MSVQVIFHFHCCNTQENRLTNQHSWCFFASWYSRGFVCEGNLYSKNCCLSFRRRRDGGWLLDPPQGWRSIGPDLGDRASACQTQCVCLCLYVYMSDFEGGGGSVWDKELLGFLHLFSYPIGVRPPLPGLQSPGQLLWCQHEFVSNLQRKNNNNKECVYPAVVLCKSSLICWNSVKLTSFKNVWVSKIRQTGRVVDL